MLYLKHSECEMSGSTALWMEGVEQVPWDIPRSDQVIAKSNKADIWRDGMG
jgi:hypothetical protein